MAIHVECTDCEKVFLATSALTRITSTKDNLEQVEITCPDCGWVNVEKFSHIYDAGPRPDCPNPVLFVNMETVEPGAAISPEAAEAEEIVEQDETGITVP